MIQCPNCAKSVPDWSKECQFCQADVKGVARPRKSDFQRGTQIEKAAWIRPALYVAAGYSILGGLQNIGSGTPMLGGKPSPGTPTALFVGTGLVMMAVGCLSALVGVGLLTKVEIARRAAIPVSGLRILTSGLILVGSLLAGGVSSSGTIFNILDIVTAGLLVYLVRETD
ncbi:hypothetical protein OP10G_0024 [Fimbriimonas ginsengisoli Gsoil 348]|uniref:Zinc ribbon domain-containing protein n=2 Tax=Fimbriimonas ginsengisoli TaxID=1005039 RepID=A0A068NIU4_FIMGI|nr:hypothetical protein OP10G_0024 [Fimbriimonas ginsengisoli Gsoil 348]